MCAASEFAPNVRGVKRTGTITNQAKRRRADHPDAPDFILYNPCSETSEGKNRLGLPCSTSLILSQDLGSSSDPEQNYDFVFADMEDWWPNTPLGTLATDGTSLENVLPTGVTPCARETLPCALGSAGFEHSWDRPSVNLSPQKRETSARSSPPSDAAVPSQQYEVGSSQTMTPKSPVDEYAMGSDEEEEMANLAPGIADICTEAPPLSVALDMDEESDYDALFDHTHQYASLKTDSTIHSQHKHIDLLDEDIDWTDVSRVTECEAPDGSVPSAS